MVNSLRDLSCIRLKERSCRGRHRRSSRENLRDHRDPHRQPPNYDLEKTIESDIIIRITSRIVFLITKGNHSRNNRDMLRDCKYLRLSKYDSF